MSPPNNNHTTNGKDVHGGAYCDKVLNHDRELGGVQAYLETLIREQRKLFERTDDLCQLQASADSELKGMKEAIGGSREEVRKTVEDEIRKMIAGCMKRAEKESGQKGRVIREGPISGFLDRSWYKFLDNVGPIVIGLLLWWLLWALSKSKFFGELPVVKFFN